MRVSDKEIKKILGGFAVVSSDSIIQSRDQDADHVKQVTAEVIAMQDREDLIADLKSRIASGAYNPSGDEIADAMIRRSIADRITG